MKIDCKMRQILPGAISLAGHKEIWVCENISHVNMKQSPSHSYNVTSVFMLRAWRHDYNISVQRTACFNARTALEAVGNHHLSLLQSSYNRLFLLLLLLRETIVCRKALIKVVFPSITSFLVCFIFFTYACQKIKKNKKKIY